LDEVALLIAAHANPGLDIAAYQRRLDDLASRCVEPVLAEVTHELFGVEGLRGADADSYYDPRNSYLDAVLDRRLGLTLSGVNLPGHFLLRMAGDPVVLIDCFAGGRLLGEAECERFFAAVHGPAAPFDPRFLDAVATVDIVARMLNNLRSVHLQRHDSVALDWVLELRGLLPGSTIEERAERAGVLAALARFGEAASLLDHLADDATEAKAAALHSQARRIRARLN
ncbi:MAG: transglutaminase-like domain-containing protein, partial [Actinomycetota bacterium]|nr:transglutaminase-like domain-containing protein [Actinomycetota bacterium]